MDGADEKMLKEDNGAEKYDLVKKDRENEKQNGDTFLNINIGKVFCYYDFKIFGCIFTKLI